MTMVTLPSMMGSGPSLEIWRWQSSQRFAVAKLFFDALSGDNVGVNAHADTKDDTGDAGQGRRGAIEHSEVTEQMPAWRQRAKQRE